VKLTIPLFVNQAIGYNFDYDAYHAFVHGRLPYDNIKPDPVLKHILKNMRIRKLVSLIHPRIAKHSRPSGETKLILIHVLLVFQIFTNGDMVHAVRALQRLGLEDCFEGIICFETLNAPCPPCDGEPKIFDIAGHFASGGTADELPKTPVLCKPNVDAMEEALRIANVNPHKAVSFPSSDSPARLHSRGCIRISAEAGRVLSVLGFVLLQIFFEDSVRNIQAGKRIGLRTVLVGTSQRVKGADHALESIHNIREALPELWEEAEKAEDVLYATERVAIETSVTA
jgi:putative hydrolase of the HAD superfamily